MINKWHKIVDGDFPKTTGDYLVVSKNKNKEDGIFLYEIAYYTGEDWDNRTNYEDIIAWCEIPKMANENKNEKKALQIKDDEKAEMIAYRLSHPLRCERCGEYVWEAKDIADTAFKAAMKMAKWKDEDAQSEKQALINKACEWLEHNVWEYTGFDSYELSEAFKKAMKGE